MKLSTHPLDDGGWLLICDVPEGRFQVEYDADGDATVLFTTHWGHHDAESIHIREDKADVVTE